MRWRIFGKSLGNGFLRTDTLANLWRMDFCELTRWLAFRESLGSWFDELTRCGISGEYLGNVFWRTDTLVNHCESLGNVFWRTDTLANLWRMFG